MFFCTCRFTNKKPATSTTNDTSLLPQLKRHVVYFTKDLHFHITTCRLFTNHFSSSLPPKRHDVSNQRCSYNCERHSSFCRFPESILVSSPRSITHHCHSSQFSALSSPATTQIEPITGGRTGAHLVQFRASNSSPYHLPQ